MIELIGVMDGLNASAVESSSEWYSLIDIGERYAAIFA
jgi:hypothetical protein